jgi:hypothetical protein
VKFVAKRFANNFFFTPLFCCCFCIWDPEWVKIRIRDKHPGSATVQNTAQETTHPLCLCKYLEVVLWVPVAVKYDDGVGGGEIDAQAARPRRQQEAEVLRAGRVEVIDRVLAQLALYSAV